MVRRISYVSFSVGRGANMCYPIRRGNRDLANSETYARCIPQFLGLRLEKIFHQGKGPTNSKYSLLLKHRHIYVYQKDREKKSPGL